MKKLLQVPLLLLLLAACNNRDSVPNAGPILFKNTGYRPIYATAEQVARVEVAAAQPLKKPGKIYVFGSYLFINESGKGVHIVNNADPKKPENLSFVSITGNYDIAVKDNWLYADNLSNLLVFDIADPKAPRLVKTVTDAIPVRNYPTLTGIYFECPDAKKGIIIDWEEVAMAERPDCYR